MSLHNLTEKEFAELKQRIRNNPRVRGAHRAEATAGSRSGGDANAGTDLAKRPGHRQLDKLPPSPFRHTLAITGQLPSGKNRIIIRRDGHRYPEKRFINWRAKAQVQIIEQWWRPFGMPRPMIQVPVCLICDYWPSDHRTRDVSGMLDAIFHLLVYCNVLKDDGLIHSVLWRRHELNRKFPKVVMELEPSFV